MWVRKSLMQLPGASGHQLPTTRQLKAVELVKRDLSLSDSLSLVFSPLTIKVGVGCCLAQSILCLFFKSNGFHLLPKGSSWSTMPNYIAHQAIVLPLMIYLVWQGTAEWFFCECDESNQTPQERVLQGSYFSKVVIGIMMWDIPVTAITPKLRNLPMMIHHIAMVATAALSLGAWSGGTPLFGYYAPFFFGVTEISTIPLVVMDLLKNSDTPSPEWLGPLFALLFLSVRALYFPYVSITRVLPDTHKVASKGIYRKALCAMALFNVLFTVLQLYWGALVVQELIKLAASTIP